MVLAVALYAGSPPRTSADDRGRSFGGDDPCSVSPLPPDQRDRIAAGLPFVESLARRVAASMPHSIELGDLVQDGMIGLD